MTKVEQYPNNSPRQGSAAVTPEMASAGGKEVVDYAPETSVPNEIAIRVYQAMERTRLSSARKKP